MFDSKQAITDRYLLDVTGVNLTGTPLKYGKLIDNFSLTEEVLLHGL